MKLKTKRVNVAISPAARRRLKRAAAKIEGGSIKQLIEEFALTLKV